MTSWSFANVIQNDTSFNTPTLQKVIASSHRSIENRARDHDRHPLETLEFFGVSSNQTVVELWSGGGWYTEILAPFLRDRGKLIVTNFDPTKSKPAKAFQDKLAASPDIFGKVKVVTIDPPQRLNLAPDNSVDVVLTFRNIHNWIISGYADKVYTAAFQALKPNGILGVEEHRAKPGTNLQESAKTGYIDENAVIAEIEKVGFKFISKSEINANPKDTKDYPDGVWTLPPTLRLGEKDKDRYLAIGESDRMTLKFIKPSYN
ncbi:class I SAM-dependent methyltransferase [Synechococcus sp. PCC 7502]|uniref:class I SAM-dependent methyltransferase n=1 Tax=Synechococcus sp. PCC 7502 TaxID=1173263 RepID=UPI000302834D|nr:methyltransferase domain-containing protein [Synechococcus sp. PCC 7502]